MSQDFDYKQIIEYEKFNIEISMNEDFIYFNIVDNTTLLKYKGLFTGLNYGIRNGPDYSSMKKTYELFVNTLKKTDEKHTFKFEFNENQNDFFNNKMLNMKFYMLEENIYDIKLIQRDEDKNHKTIFVHNLFKINNNLKNEENIITDNNEETILLLKNEIERLKIENNEIKIRYNDLFKIAEFVSTEYTGMEIYENENGNYYFHEA